jgi:hypothetical protein
MGQPFLHKIARDIDALGGEEWFFGEIADGTKLRELAEKLGCSRPLLYRWMKLEPSREEAWRLSRELRAHSLAEDTDDEVAQGGSLSPGEAQALNTRVRYRQWLAERYNRKDFGQEKGSQITLNVGSLHAEVLRARSQERALPPPAIPVVEATEVE